uniref:Uncharacterized protein n=1 Tax=Salix viminalis TaxID=40686 RepID=A0A6N2L0Y2_SALVM
MKLKQSSNRVRIIVNREAESLCLQPPRFSLHHPHLPPPTPQMKSPPRATSARLNDHPSRGSMKEALEGELELGSPENRRCSSTREGG